MDKARGKHLMEAGNEIYLHEPLRCALSWRLHPQLWLLCFFPKQLNKMQAMGWEMMREDEEAGRTVKNDDGTL